MSYRLGILVSHPIQYYAPWLRHLARQMEIEVFYAHRQDGRGQAEAGFGVAFEWDRPLLEGYPYRWLQNVATRPDVGSFTGLDTPEICDIVRQGEFAAFLIFGWNRKCFWQAIHACRRSRVPVLMRGDSQLETPRSASVRLLKYLPYRLLLPRPAGHLYVGQRNRAYLRHYGVPDDKLFFVPHCVDNAFFATCAAEARAQNKQLWLRRSFNIPDEAFVLLFVGKLIPKKRPADLIQACGQLLTSGEPLAQEIHALFVGDGPLREELIALAHPYQDHIHFAGFGNQSEMPAYYAASDVLVLPSNGEETWGLVVNEAMACGLPAIVSDSAGCVPDLIDEGATGAIYSSGDVHALAERILKLRQLLQDSSQLIGAAVSKKMKQYSLESAAAGLQAALDKIG